MDSDRWSYLAVRAYTKGVLKLSSEERQDSRWRLREELLLGEVERDIVGELRQMLHRTEIAAAQYSAGGNIFKHHYEQATVHYVGYQKAMMPYDKSYEFDSKALIRAWNEVYGDPETPEVAKQIAETEKYLQDKAKGLVN